MILKHFLIGLSGAGIIGVGSYVIYSATQSASKEDDSLVKSEDGKTDKQDSSKSDTQKQDQNSSPLEVTTTHNADGATSFPTNPIPTAPKK